MPTNPPQTPEKPIIFFDGECNLCNGFVDLMLQIDPAQTFYLAPLQGETAKELLPPLPADPKTWSIAYHDPEKTLYASDAVLAIAEKLGLPWSLIIITRPLPQDFRDWLYRIVADNRYTWFGKRTCRPLNPENPAPFLP